MTTAADSAITALRAVHDDLAARVAGYADSDLARSSGATEWTLAQVLSHIGSGAEITRVGLEAALVGTGPAGPTFNQSVWDRWNAMTARQQAEQCVPSDAALLGAYEALDDATRRSLRIALPFLPAPVGLDVACVLRLNEAALHLWDLAVADDPSARLHPAAAPVLLDALSGPLSFLIGSSARTAEHPASSRRAPPTQPATSRCGWARRFRWSPPHRTRRTGPSSCPPRRWCGYSPGAFAPSTPPRGSRPPGLSS